MSATPFIAIAPDGVEVRATEIGHGPPVLILPPGMDDGRGYRAVAARLAAHHRVVVLHRRQYRLDLDRPASIADEVSDAVALAEALGRRPLLVGHSSGAVIGLECLAAEPSSFIGAALYEPPLPRESPNTGTSLERAQRAVAERRPGRAMQIFTHEMVGLPKATSRLIGGFISLHPRMRKMAARQIADVAAMHALGPRNATYATITSPTLLIGGDRSPGDLARQLGLLAVSIPGATRVTLAGQGHSAQMRSPDKLADLIESFYSEVQERTDPR